MIGVRIWWYMRMCANTIIASANKCPGLYGHWPHSWAGPYVAHPYTPRGVRVRESPQKPRHFGVMKYFWLILRNVIFCEFIHLLRLICCNLLMIKLSPQSYLNNSITCLVPIPCPTRNPTVPGTTVSQLPWFSGVDKPGSQNLDEIAEYPLWC